ncbi:S41 family peptidase [Anaerorhabdus furcosa]|uniref:Carboxyl-terminal processing protease n=1 Tax=Anaerorhabdus furcosa TaxID=118967 RepID=A0A1T4K6S8_9FIRM|nr:S41 family peptidase [Anaerorhabdus furcosa]SJZ38037.1 carboxyl-terminal processing protease [Anaerorhabdus furcosa]
MSNEEEKDDDKKVRIKLERHIWPDEAEKKEQKFQRRLFTVFIVVSMIFVFVVGWLIGNAKVIQINPTTQEKQQSKIDYVMDLLENNWYFAKDDPDIQEHLMDRALYGMATSEEDPHTTYFSSDELQNFTQSINMNFVGIGVQFTTNEGVYLINRVFKNSPAEKAGVLPGDIINKIDGVSVEGLTTDDIKDRVRGESGTNVSIEFLRGGKPVTLDISRAEVNGTTYGKMLQDDIGYLEIYGFGDSTGYEVEAYLDEMKDAGMKKLVIDLRDNGGGYLDAFVDVVSFFVDKDVVVMKQEYANGSVQETLSLGGKYDNIEDIVILINEQTASASEVLTIALQELRDNVTVMGTTSYGKGTVQITQPFTDGSALKYTSSKWLSPSGVSIDGVGIKPDIEVKLHDILYEAYLPMEETDSFTVDQVSNYVRILQEGLDYLGYSVNRTDGYFDESTLTALKQFEKNLNITQDGILDKGTFEAIVSSVVKEYSLNEAKDAQLNEAINVLKENQ